MQVQGKGLRSVPAQISQQLFHTHPEKVYKPVCSLASITGTTVFPHVIDHANPVETFSKFSKSFIPAKMPTTYQHDTLEGLLIFGVQ